MNDFLKALDYLASQEGPECVVFDGYGEDLQCDIRSVAIDTLQALRDQQAAIETANLRRAESETTLWKEIQKLIAKNKAYERIAELEAVIDALEEKLNRITQWCKAYPRTVFIEPTPEQWARADHVLQQASDCPSLAAISGSNMRHVVEQITKLGESNG